MGEGKEEKTRDSPDVEVQERGEIFFYYRPKVNNESPHSVDDVQRVYIVLAPESGERKTAVKQSSDSGHEGKFKETKEGEELSGDHEDPSVEGDRSSVEVEGTRETEERQHREKRRRRNGEEDEIPDGDYEEEQKTDDGSRRGEEREAGKGLEKVTLSEKTLMRFIVMGRKTLPNPSRKRSGTFWGFVDLVTTDPNDIKQSLAEEKYDTKTRGQRTKPAARSAGNGIYRIARHKVGSRTRTHLTYKLESQELDEHDEMQEDLNIAQEGSFLIQIKNPEQRGVSQQRNAGLQNKKKATYPAHLQEHMGSYQFVAADPPDFLNYEGCEFILISASDNIEEELGLDLEVEGEFDVLHLLNS